MNIYFSAALSHDRALGPSHRCVQSQTIRPHPQPRPQQTFQPPPQQHHHLEKEFRRFRLDVDCPPQFQDSGGNYTTTGGLSPVLLLY